MELDAPPLNSFIIDYYSRKLKELAIEKIDNDTRIHFSKQMTFQELFYPKVYLPDFSNSSSILKAIL